MNRAETIAYINEQILPTAEISNDDWFLMGREIMRKIIKGISTWRHGKNINIEMHARIIDGVLFINSDCVARVAPKLPRKAWSEVEYITEGRILAKQEID